jgi:hypothetical protein
MFDEYYSYSSDPGNPSTETNQFPGTLPSTPEKGIENPPGPEKGQSSDSGKAPEIPAKDYTLDDFPEKNPNPTNR